VSITSIGPVAVQHKTSGDAMLLVALNVEDMYLCIRAEDGELEWFPRGDIVVTGWSFSPDLGIWVSENEEFEAAVQEEVSGEPLD